MVFSASIWVETEADKDSSSVMLAPFNRTKAVVIMVDAPPSLFMCTVFFQTLELITMLAATNAGRASRYFAQWSGL